MYDGEPRVLLMAMMLLVYPECCCLRDGVSFFSFSPANYKLFMELSVQHTSFDPLDKYFSVITAVECPLLLFKSYLNC